MTLRAPTLPFRSLKKTVAEAKADQEFIELVMAHWDAGKNTTDIAEFTFEDEAAVAAALSVGREQRRGG